MKRYIREVFISEYAKNFNKGLSKADIKFYGKIHFDRSRSDNELNMHCHLIVSWKDQANKKKLSPLTNHKNTKNGIIKGGFDRVSLFQQAEQRFNKLFNYDRQLSESFDFRNTMKNSSVSEQLKLQRLQFCEKKQKSIKTAIKKICFLSILKIRKNVTKLSMQTTILPQNQKNTSVNPIFTPVNNQIFKLPNFLTISKDASSTFNQGEQVQKSKKRKKRKL